MVGPRKTSRVSRSADIGVEFVDQSVGGCIRGGVVDMPGERVDGGSDDGMVLTCKLKL